MEARSRSEADRRSGVDRRKYADPHYSGPERRSGQDRRAAAGAKKGIPSWPFVVRETVAYAEEDVVTAHRLSPATGRFLSPLVVLNRIGSEFAYVEADEEGGRRYVLEMLKRLEARRGVRTNSAYQDRLERLKQVQDRAVYVLFGDDPGSDMVHLSVAVIPGEPLIFEYESPAHERLVRPLLRRCAQVLGYDIVQVAVEDVMGHLSMSTLQ